MVEVVFFAILLGAVLIGVFIRKINTPASEGVTVNFSPFEIYCTEGDLVGNSYAINDQQTVIGRDNLVDITISNNGVSRRHSAIQVTERGILLQDLDSMNGSWFYKQQEQRWERVHNIYLDINEEFLVGSCRFRTTSKDSSFRFGINRGAQSAELVANTTDFNQLVDLRNYEFIKQIGQGGAASVVLAKDKSNNKQVAIKRLHNSVDNYFQQKFLHEIEINKLLRKVPHVVPILGIAQQNDDSFIIMEYMKGSSLRERMHKRKVSVEEAVGIIQDVSIALDGAHKLNIFHRDIKPENILFDGENNAYLADFGIARLTSLPNVTQEGMIVGTPEYMSYEQASGDEVVSQSDQYALAIVLYEMLTGRCPYMGEPLEIVGKHLDPKTKPMPPIQLNSKVPKAINDAILKALSKKVENRHLTMLDFSAALSTRKTALSQISQRWQTRSVVKTLQFVEANSNRALFSVGSNQSLMIGRETLDFNGVSRQHAVVWFEKDKFLIDDAGSRNGTYLNKQRVTGPVPIEPGNTLQLGAATLLVSNGQTAGR